MASSQVSTTTLFSSYSILLMQDQWSFFVTLNASSPLRRQEALNIAAVGFVSKKPSLSKKPASSLINSGSSNPLLQVNNVFFRKLTFNISGRVLNNYRNNVQVELIIVQIDTFDLVLEENLILMHLLVLTATKKRTIAVSSFFFFYLLPAPFSFLSSLHRFLSSQSPASPSSTQPHLIAAFPFVPVSTIAVFLPPNSHHRRAQLSLSSLHRFCFPHPQPSSKVETPPSPSSTQSLFTASFLFSPPQPSSKVETPPSPSSNQSLFTAPFPFLTSPPLPKAETLPSASS
ncbi:uncharacterized protein DS421_1g11730 [Arachis hypogaea]|nr:uncharacterized protein DS421_1g11730 [Arachis hypogaea]